MAKAVTLHTTPQGVDAYRVFPSLRATNTGTPPLRLALYVCEIPLSLLILRPCFSDRGERVQGFQRQNAQIKIAAQTAVSA